MKHVLLVMAIAGCVSEEPGDPLPEAQPLAAPTEIASTVVEIAGDSRAIAAGASGVYWIDGGGLWRRPPGGTTEQLSDRTDLTHVFVDGESYAFARRTGPQEYVITVMPLAGSTPTELEVDDVVQLANIGAGSVWYVAAGTSWLTRRLVTSEETRTYQTAGGVLLGTQLDEDTVYLQSTSGIVRFPLTSDGATTAIASGVTPGPVNTAYAAARGRVVFGTITEDPTEEFPPYAAQISATSPGGSRGVVLADYGERQETSGFAAVPVGEDVVLLNGLGMFRVRRDNTIERFTATFEPRTAVGGDDRIYYVVAGRLFEQVLP